MAEKSGEITLTDIRVTLNAVQDKVSKLKLNPHKAPGPNQVPPRVLKELSEQLAMPLCSLFNKSLQSGLIPDDWKVAFVTAIFKTGTKSDPGNYTPVSLTCVTRKLLESFVKDAALEHMTDNSLYSKCQHEFHEHRSCGTQLLEVMEDLTQLTDNGYPVDVVYLDF